MPQLAAIPCGLLRDRKLGKDMLPNTQSHVALSALTAEPAYTLSGNNQQRVHGQLRGRFFLRKPRRGRRNGHDRIWHGQLFVLRIEEVFVCLYFSRFFSSDRT